MDLTESPFPSFEKVGTICQLIDNTPAYENYTRSKICQCKYNQNSILLQEIDPFTGKLITLKKYNTLDKVFIANKSCNELNDYFLYNNDSPVSYLLNGYNASMICIGIKGSCKSRILFGNNLREEIVYNDSLLCNLINELFKYSENTFYFIGISMGDLVYDGRNETLFDLLNSCTVKDIDGLINVQITYKY